MVSFSRKDLLAMKDYFQAKLSANVRNCGQDINTILDSGDGIFCRQIEMLMLIDILLNFTEDNHGEMENYKEYPFPQDYLLFENCNEQRSQSKQCSKK